MISPPEALPETPASGKASLTDGMAEEPSLVVPLILMMVSAFSLTLSSFFAELAMDSVSTYLAVTTRFLVPFLLMTAWFAWRQELKVLTWDGVVDSKVRGLALVLSQYFLYVAISGMTLAEATVLYNTGPIFITLYSIIKNRRVDPLQILALIMGATGVCFILHVENGSHSSMWLISAGLLSGFFQAVSQIQLHKATHKESPSLAMYYTYAAGSLACLTALIMTRYVLHVKVFHLGFHHLLIAQEIGLTLLFLLGNALGSMGNQQFRGQAYAMVNDPAVLSPLIYSTVFISAVFDFFYKHIVPGWHEIVGALLIVGAAIVILEENARHAGHHHHH